MPAWSTRSLGQIAVLLILLFGYTTWDVFNALSPQGCRMSWMSPSYILQTRFNSTWSPLAKRYKLWLYREVGWDAVEDTGLRKDSLPVLFIPGNAGSARQIRSIASSASRQFYESPHVVSGLFQSRNLKPLDFFTVDFNEDLSAFHGTTIDSQIVYTTQAIAYILSQYPEDTKIIIMGHSMGGIVAASLLPSSNVSAIITMSTPFTLAPVRFDSRIDRLYQRLQVILKEDRTPILSLCGGAKDLMISSESCILPKASNGVFRKTVFTSALEGSWSAVGHQEMVWCHQVRWRVARTALELGQAVSNLARGHILDRWLRDGHTLPPVPLVDDEELHSTSDAEVLDVGVNLRLIAPHGSTTTLLPLSSEYGKSDDQHITVLVSQGAIGGVSPQDPIPLKVSIFLCRGDNPRSVQCSTLHPDALRLIPNPVLGSTFPVPGEGADESEGVVLYETRLPPITRRNQQNGWIGIKTTGGDGRGWVVAGLNRTSTNIVNIHTWSLLLGKASVHIPETQGLSIPFSFPNLLSNGMVVYRVFPHRSPTPPCTDGLLPPLLVHTSHQAETHYFPWLHHQDQRILLHTHLEGPFIDSSALGESAVNFTIQSSREYQCQKDLTGFDITLDWSATLGRWGSRYLNALLSWAAGVAAVVVFIGWNQETDALMPTVEQSLDRYSRLLFRYLLPCSLLAALVPLPVSLYTGNDGQPFLSPIAPTILLVASGLVNLIWRILQVLLVVCSLMNKALCGTRKAKASIQSGTIVSLLIICAVIFLLIPWQVVYLGCWLLHLYTCGSTPQSPKSPSTANNRSSNDVPMQSRKGNMSPTYLPGRHTSNAAAIKQYNLNHNQHLLLLMTWFLPLTAPVLAVWVRTLLTAGYTTPFDGDHNFVSVLPFLVLVDFASWTPSQLFERPSFEKRLPLKWLFALLAAAAFIFGARRPYLVLDVGRVAISVVVACRIGRRYWGGPSWL